MSNRTSNLFYFVRYSHSRTAWNSEKAFGVGDWCVMLSSALSGSRFWSHLLTCGLATPLRFRSVTRSIPMRHTGFQNLIDPGHPPTLNRAKTRRENRRHLEDAAGGAPKCGRRRPPTSLAVHRGHPLRHLFGRNILAMGRYRPVVPERVCDGRHPVAPELIGRLHLRRSSRSHRTLVQRIHVSDVQIE